MAGSIILTFAFVASVAAVLFYFRSIGDKSSGENAAGGNSQNLLFARYSYYVASALVLLASALLLSAILNHNYQYKYVYEYSGSGLSLGLLMSTFYAGQEGSFLLWALFSSLTGLVLMRYLKKGRGELESSVMAVYSIVITFLLAIVSPMLKNPFEWIWAAEPFIPVKDINPQFLSLPFLTGFMFTDNNTGEHFVKITSALNSHLASSGLTLNQFIMQGRGLNPLLQNFWMQIHPPMLFVGFALAAVPFSFAVSALIRNEYSSWVTRSFPWLIAGNMVLGGAIMLGGYWAYGVLGWGGYWGWDPVENSSLVPWLIGAGLLHTMVVQRKGIKAGRQGDFLRTNLVLSMAVFITVLYSTFLTRSGILGDASVHSFTDPGHSVYIFLIVFIMTFLLLGAGYLVYRRKSLAPEAKAGQRQIISRESGLFFGAAVLVAVSAIVIAGTSAPIFGKAVEVSFYENMSLPLGILIGLLNGLSLLLKWQQSATAGELIKRSVPAAVTAVVLSALVILISGTQGIMLMLLIWSASFAALLNIEIAYRVMRTNPERLGAYVAHIGVAVFLLGVGATSGLGVKRSADLIKDKPQEMLGYTFTFKGYEQAGEKYVFNVEIRDKNSQRVASPVMYYSKYNGGLMREPDIVSGLLSDLYISPLGYDDGSASASDQGGRQVTLKKGKTVDVDGRKLTFTGFEFSKDAMSTMMSGGNFEIGAQILVEFQGNSITMVPKMKNQNGERIFEPVTDESVNMTLALQNLDASGSVAVQIAGINGGAIKTSPSEVLSVETSIKPLIILVWAGVVIAIAGYVISMLRRRRELEA